jgi:hypothetical protein
VTTLVLLILPLLAGCAGEGAASQGPAAPEGLARFNGLYQGQQIPVGAEPACRREPHTVWFRIRDGLVELRTSRHRHSAVQRPIMTGTVTSRGEIALDRDGSERRAAGQITGDRLTATEIPITSAAQPAAGCGYRYEATRMGGGAP